MRYNPNPNQNLRPNNLRKEKTKININLLKEKKLIKYDITKLIKKEKDRETAVYKRHNTEYDIPIPRFKVIDSDIIKLNLEKNRNRNYVNEENKLYPGGITLLQNEGKKIMERKEILEIVIIKIMIKVIKNQNLD